MSEQQGLIKHQLKTFDKYEIFMISDEILCVHYFQDKVIEADDLRQALQIGEEISPSSETRLIVWVDQYVDVTNEAREIAQNEMRELKAEAHVFPSLANKILFNVFIKFRKNKHPLKAFSSLEAAISWIESK